MTTEIMNDRTIIRARGSMMFVDMARMLAEYVETVLAPTLPGMR